MTEWKVVQGSQPNRPTEFDTTSSATTVYQRRNIHTTTVEEENGETVILWEYDERELTRDEFTGLSLQNALSAIASIEDALCELDASN